MTLLDLTPPRQLAIAPARRCPSRSSAPGPIGLAAAAQPRRTRHRLRRARGGRPRRRERRGSGGTSGSSRRGSTSSTRRRGACSPRPAGRAAGRTRLPTGSELVEAVPRPARRASRDRRPDPARRRGAPTSPARAWTARAPPAARSAVPAARAHRRRRRGAQRPRGHRRLGHLPLAEPPRLLGARPARPARGRRPGRSRPARRARPRARVVRRPAHHRGGRRPLRRQHPAEPGRARRRRSPARASPGSSATPPRVRVTTSPDDELQARAPIGARVDELVAAGRIDVVDRFEIVRARARSRRRRRRGIRAHHRRRGDGLDDASTPIAS